MLSSTKPRKRFIYQCDVTLKWTMNLPQSKSRIVYWCSLQPTWLLRILSMVWVFVHHLKWLFIIQVNFFLYISGISSGDENMENINTEPMLLPVKFLVENTIHTLTSSSIAMLYQSWWNSSAVPASKPNVWLFPRFPYANNVCISLSLICNLNLHRHSPTLHQTLQTRQKLV